eukprot:CAMPEP_0175119894 /NCGR_PEP_ID=MMETSP0087-20121206/322_1 /TAXON_ID=136419 /ORGANISM="Unknown Unknown, Strain D1" /LENGTH=100 /DNA_ID=CAMNT_0016401287 /DNA_START=45 /DNA_END=344 /DNA_ORIENTATION=-
MGCCESLPSKEWVPMTEPVGGTESNKKQEPTVALSSPNASNVPAAVTDVEPKLQPNHDCLPVTETVGITESAKTGSTPVALSSPNATPVPSAVTELATSN